MAFPPIHRQHTRINILLNRPLAFTYRTDNDLRAIHHDIRFPPLLLDNRHGCVLSHSLLSIQDMRKKNTNYQ